MTMDKKLETFEEEIKLMKGELKQSLSSVRDYLLNMELPASEFAALLAALGNEGNNDVQKVQLESALAKSALDSAPDDEAMEEGGGEGEPDSEPSLDNELDAPPEDEDLIDLEKPSEDESEVLPEDGLPEAEEEFGPEDSLIDEQPAVGEEAPYQEEAELPEESRLDEDEGDEYEGAYDEETEENEEDEEEVQEPAVGPDEEEEEAPMEYEKVATVARDSVPRVNMLANLIGWIAMAKKEIGDENLPTLLEVYGISGYLSPELKDVIIYLSSLSSEMLNANGGAWTWSRTMLSLHGILTGGDAPNHPVVPDWLNDEGQDLPVDEEIIEVDKAKEEPIKLKLVLPDGNGKSHEFCVNLTPEATEEAAEEEEAAPAKPTRGRRK
jgi:hypothetical protein